MRMQEEMISRNVSVRAKACLMMAIINLGCLFVPLPNASNWLLVLVVIAALNILVGWAILKGVGPWKDPEEHARALMFVKLGALALGILATVIAVMLIVAERLHAIGVAFLLSSYGFVVLTVFVFDLSIKRKIEKLKKDDE